MRGKTLVSCVVLIGVAALLLVSWWGRSIDDLHHKKGDVAERPRILVLRLKLPGGAEVKAADTAVRALTDSEMERFVGQKHKYMPPIPDAANLRVLAHSVEADEPLLKENFEPAGLKKIIPFAGPGMRA